MRIELPNPPRNILLIKPSSLGDVVQTLPALNLLRRRWPRAKISWLISRAFAELIEGHPQLDRTIVFDRGRYARGWYNPRAAVDLVHLLFDLGREKFDLVIDLQGLLRSGWLAAATRAPVRVGFANARELAHLFYTHRVPVDYLHQHAIDRYLTVTDSLGCGREPVQFNFHVRPEDRTAVQTMVGDLGRFVVLLPGTRWTTKQWPVERFAQLVEPLRRRAGVSTVVAGTSQEAEVARRIPADVNAVGKTTLRQLVALLDRAELVITNDSGPMHIAAALGKPLVAIFGPTNPLRTGPYRRLDTVIRAEIPCSPCYSRKCSHVSCLRSVDAETVLIEALRQMGM